MERILKTPIEALEQARQVFSQAERSLETSGYGCDMPRFADEIAAIDAVIRTARCAKCRGVGTVRVRREVIETSNPSGVAEFYCTEPCPVCRKEAS